MVQFGLPNCLSKYFANLALTNLRRGRTQSCKSEYKKNASGISDPFRIE